MKYGDNFVILDIEPSSPAVEEEKTNPLLHLARAIDAARIKKDLNELFDIVLSMADQNQQN